MTDPSHSEISAVLLDYGGVFAEEGFRDGLIAIGRAAGLEPAGFFELAAAAVYDSGYVVGKGTEQDFFGLVRKQTGISASDREIRQEIFSRFVLRPWMVQVVQSLRSGGYRVCMLSDQTDWLDALDKRDGFFKYFDIVFNSYYLGKGKKDASVFTDVAARLNLPASRLLFADDNLGHIERARSKGLHTILYQDRPSFLAALHDFGLLDGAGTLR
jgi:putative hydrolase of the HAD superfamily